MSAYSTKPQQVFRLPDARPGDLVRLRGEKRTMRVAAIFAAITETEAQPVWRARMESGEVLEARSLVVEEKP